MSGLVCNVSRKYGVVLRTTLALSLVVPLSIWMKAGASGVGRLPPEPLNVTAPVCARALPSIVELAYIVMEAYASMVPLKTEDV
jgi:hypothetical protein